ncbi:MAG: biotin--[acetyl-CoA-carboxylase] ligase [Glaciimonas sp.]|nr:biotin--[acetyl-CoA-carboxylase] ligase [Glaciimonas sp.]
MTSHLSAERIFALSTLQPQDITIEVVAETGSTNADLLTRVQSSPWLTTAILRIAEHQTAGRGRAGRTWASAPSTALMFSLAWPFARPLQALVGLPLAVGVSIATSLTHYLGHDAGIRLKWPNDLLLEGQKLGGILIETSKTNRQTWAIIGIGLNLAVPAELQQVIGRNVANFPSGHDLDRNALMAVVLHDLRQTLQQFEQDGLAPFVASWNGLHAYTGQQVVILDQGEIRHEGSALGIDEIGRLLLQSAQSDEPPIAIMAGDISLRVKESI